MYIYKYYDIIGILYIYDIYAAMEILAIWRTHIEHMGKNGVYQALWTVKERGISPDETNHADFKGSSEIFHSDVINTGIFGFKMG